MQAGDELRLFEQFVYNEALIMDEHRYDDWFDLWDKDALYWLPCNTEDVDPGKKVSLVYEDYEKIEERILRLKSKFAHTQNPKSRLMRVVSNICLETASDNQITGTSVFVLGEVRIDVETTWYGRTHHTLIRTDNGLKIKRKKVFILNNDAPMKNMTFLV